ncbi:MAG: glucanotransferase, partial [Clostridiales bacterium]
MSKKSKYFWKKILILTWVFSLFLGILAGPCAVDAKNQKEKKEYGVFLSIDSSQIKKLYGYRLVVIDAQYFSAKDIRTLHKKGVKVYTYLNVGSIENFRDYYKKYEYLTIGTYENWEEEKWVDVSNKDWQKFMGKLSKKLLKKGVDGFFIDNCDVYDYAKTKKNFKGLAKILKNIKR